MQRVKHAIWRCRVVFALGLVNIFRVFVYRLLLNVELHPVCKLSPVIILGTYFRGADIKQSRERYDAARESWKEYEVAFGEKGTSIKENEIPDWHLNVLTGIRFSSQENWWKIPDNSPSIGDIKGIWDKSRFDWLIAFAQRAANGSTIDLDRANRWLEDWSEKNPPYKGSNWMCAQEASIRVIHLSYAAKILCNFSETSKPLLQLLELHLDRILPTISYAKAQNNNHITSEAVALFVGGSWLIENQCKQKGVRFQRVGRRLLNKYVDRLVLEDGTFSQYSPYYHRLFLDSIAYAEIVRAESGFNLFSPSFYQKARRATLWLHDFVDPLSGSVPNIGQNDGSRILALTDYSYNDFRPTLRNAVEAFYSKDVCTSTPEQCLSRDGLKLNAGPMRLPESRIYNAGGFISLVRGTRAQIRSFIRFPNFKFRPKQNDLLHLDLWVDGVNLLMDSGSYRYTDFEESPIDLSSVKAHNTVQFGEREQMPRLGRFLLAEWPSPKNVRGPAECDAGRVNAGVAYTDYCGSTHERRLALSESELSVTDIIRGDEVTAWIRWHLPNLDWRVDAERVSCESGIYSIFVRSDEEVSCFRVIDSWISPNYGKKVRSKTLEFKVRNPSTTESFFRWQ